MWWSCRFESAFNVSVHSCFNFIKINLSTRRSSWHHFLFKTMLHKTLIILNSQTIISNTPIKKWNVKWLTHRSFVCSVYSWFLVTFESITQHMIANRSVALVMGFYLSLVFTCLLRNLVHNCFEDAKFVDVTVFHVFMFDVTVVDLIFLLDRVHFFLNFNFIFCFDDCFEFLSHVSWVFTF